jgi:hypothetical protein
MKGWVSQKKYRKVVQELEQLKDKYWNQSILDIENARREKALGEEINEKVKNVIRGLSSFLYGDGT